MAKNQTQKSDRGARGTAEHGVQLNKGSQK